MPALSKGNWSKVAIGGLVLVNVVLLALLVLREPSRTVAAVPAPTEGAQSAERSPSAVTTTMAPAQSSTTSSPSPTAEPSETGTPTPAVRSTRVLAVNSETLAWRGVFGACPTAPDVEVSRDGGRTWTPTSTDLRSLSRLRSFGGSSVFAVGGSDDCAARYVTAGGPGDPWRSNDEMLGDTWYRLPDAPHRVQAPGGRVSRPCGDEPGDVAGLGDDNAAAVCPDGTVRTTGNSGRAWRDLEGGADGLAIGADDGVYVLALKRPGCDGTAVTVFDPGAERVGADDLSCAPVDPGAGGELAVAVRDQTVWIWAGDEVVTSTNRGRTWEQN